MQVEWGWLIFTAIMITLLVLRLRTRPTALAKRKLKEVIEIINFLEERITRIEIILLVKHNDRLAAHRDELVADLKKFRTFQESLVEFLHKG